MPRLKAARICIIRLSALGDIIHALALVNGLRRGYPDAHITWILQPAPHQMILPQPGIDRFVVFQRRGGLQAFSDLRRELRNERFDLTITPQVSLKASLISACVRSTIKLGFDYNRSREFHWLFTNRHIPPRPPRHVLDQFIEFLDYLEIPAEPIRWGIFFTDEELAWRQRYFSQFDRPVVAFVIASSTPDKDWPTDRIAEVISWVESKLKYQTLILGGPTPREADLVNEVIQKCEIKPAVALEKPIRHTLLQISGAEEYVGW